MCLKPPRPSKDHRDKIKVPDHPVEDLISHKLFTVKSTLPFYIIYLIIYLFIYLFIYLTDSRVSGMRKIAFRAREDMTRDYRARSCFSHAPFPPKIRGYTCSKGSPINAGEAKDHSLPNINTIHSTFAN